MISFELERRASSESERRMLERFKGNLPIANYFDKQYYLTLYFGSSREPVTLIVDTGSSWTWLPREDCKGCPKIPSYRTSQSTTYKEVAGASIPLEYGVGTLVG